MDDLDGFIEIDRAIEDALKKLGPARRKKAHREAIQYLRRENKRRIVAQQNIDGSGYTPRKNKRRKRGKMMRSMPGRIKAQWGLESAELFLNGIIAQVHHFGRTEKGVKYPSRQLLGISKKDKQAVLDILIKNLELQTI